ncbi:MAG TPA: GNAT family N-acetyltransferase [Planctomycetaceae bacterium]|nr:GNAT family N-acetyltransferase [Planctomycetaceae bacterium]
MHFLWTEFGDLSPARLYALLKLRQNVFVIEQNCIFPEMDDRDQLARHLLVFRDPEHTELIGSARILDGPVIGRIVVAESARGVGVGHEIMRAAVDECERLLPGHPIRMSVQSHLTEFYQRHGFILTGEPYVEDGIDHTDMIRER